MEIGLIKRNTNYHKLSFVGDYYWFDKKKKCDKSWFLFFFYSVHRML